MHVLLSYNCVLTVVKYTDMLCYVMKITDNKHLIKLSTVNCRRGAWLNSVSFEYFVTLIAGHDG